MVVCMNLLVTTHALLGPCVPPLFDCVLRTCSNQPLPSGLRPTAVLETTMSKSKGELVVSVSIIPNQQGSPAGKLADAEVMFGAESGPLSGDETGRLRSMGTSRWREKRDVPGPAVLRQRRTPELRTAASRERGRQRAGGDQAEHPGRVRTLRGACLMDQRGTRTVRAQPRRPGPRFSRDGMMSVGRAADVSRKGRRYGNRDALCR